MSMTFKHIPVGLIYKKDNIREELETELGDLQASIEQFDMLQPILVRPVGNKYEIVSGHRRYAAMKLYGAAKYAEKMAGYLGEGAKKLTAGQIHARAKKAGFVGTRKASKDLEVYHAGNSIQIKAKSEEARDKVLELLEAEFPLKNVRRKG